jgi:hypothetical protein
LIVSGGVVAPVLMLAGLERISGVTGSLLLNLEGPFTIIVALHRGPSRVKRLSRKRQAEREPASARH